MHFYLYIIILLQGVSCKKDSSLSAVENLIKQEESFIIPDNFIIKTELHFDKYKSLWLFNDKPYSGYSIVENEEGMVIEKTGILNGKKQNESIIFYPDGKYKYLSNYSNGKLHGEKKAWIEEPSYILISHLNYQKGKLHGVQKKWYPTGEIFKVLNMNMGKEEGIQRAYRKNGVLYANYEAKAGRTFGLRKAALCFELEDEKIKYEN